MSGSSLAPGVEEARLTSMVDQWRQEILSEMRVGRPCAQNDLSEVLAFPQPHQIREGRQLATTTTKVFSIFCHRHYVDADAP